jgi:hypothetical protein
MANAVTRKAAETTYRMTTPFKCNMSRLPGIEPVERRLFVAASLTKPVGNVPQILRGDNLSAGETATI